MLRRLVAMLALLGLVLSFSVSAFADQRSDNVEKIRKAGGGDLAQKIASCEGLGTNDPFQGKPIQESVDLINSGETHDWGTASTRWGSYKCWHGGGGGGGRARGRSAPAAPPTGTDHCDRTSGEWRCVGSYIYPDALTITPDIEADQGWQGCGWTKIETAEFWWYCH